MPKLTSIVTLGSVIVSLSVVYSCAGPSTPAAATRRLTESDAGGSIALRVGDKLEVVLSGNPTTGYQWEIGAGDAAILRPSGEPLFVADSSAVGSGGKFTFSFEAVGAGQTGLKLIYHRPFEKGVPPLQTFQVTVTVK